MKKNVALYDPYLDIMGGGEKHILSILQVLEKQGYNISIFWDQDVNRLIKDKLNLTFQHLTFLPNILRSGSVIKKLQILKSFDLFFYVTDGSYFFSSANKNIVFCMVPNQSLYKMNIANKLKTLNYDFVANSIYTQQWLQKWGIKSNVIYPYVSDDFLKEIPKKEKIILSVGRFFGHLHAKKHEEIIKTFQVFQKTNPNFKLILVGGLKDEDRLYFESLVKVIGNNKSILLEPNAPYSELIEYYRKSLFFWHFTGYGVKEEEHPEMVEHLGMTPVEAMACGTIPFCYNAGGPKEIITNGVNGFLFTTIDDLLSKTEAVQSNSKLYKAIQKNGQEYVKKLFTYKVFENTVKETIL